MKKLIVAISAIFYLAISSGLVFSLHYCMGKLAGVEFKPMAYSSKTCVCGSGEEESDCCKTELKVVKLEQDQKSTPFQTFDFSPFEAEISFFFHLSSERPFTEPQGNTLFCNGPPDLQQDKPIYLRNNVFRL